MKHAVSIVIMAMILALAGCGTSTPSEPRADMFSVKVEMPEAARAGETFVVEGALANGSRSEWKIEHGADMFTYAVFDEEGNPVLQDGSKYVHMIGFGKVLEPDESYSNDGEGHVLPPNNELKLKAGSYTLVATAEFRIKHGGEDLPFKIQSKPYPLHVS
ncbi:hypothetical protein [Paenibacillus arenilitoris]|uniref:Uncharacterized protein n=1 Tax=Paenibacillus arenilitoris TaxID=2772299 RepID=A0A927CIA9_9BACL|nr:hypothetical protein [Paenibacillus arenilitoris]MBD2867187.1 hypothetical protein [Paenibacillus arenilitoris]